MGRKFRLSVHRKNEERKTARQKESQRLQISIALSSLAHWPQPQPQPHQPQEIQSTIDGE